MAPSTVIDHAEANGVDIAARAAVKQAELNGTAERPPVADDYMYDFKYNHALPTTDVLGVQVPQDCDAQAEAEGIVRQLSDALGSGHAEAFADLFLEY
ncbi:putative indole-3-pyruvate monooxygenase YUCCA4, partial [Colletotrichum sp. SAR 10_86]